MNYTKKINNNKRTHAFIARLCGLVWMVMLAGASTEVVAQSDEIGIPSPTAASLGKYAETPINLSKGAPQVSVPIFTVQGGKLTIPISLSYNATGVRVEDIPDWVGTGWSLNAGGVITRAKRGGPDENTSKGYYYNKSNIDQIELETGAVKNDDVDFVRNLISEGYDLEPDMFYYNVGGLTGSFVLGFHNDSIPHPVTIPQSDVLIEPTFVSNEIHAFKLIAPDGTKYFFEEYERAEHLSGSTSTQDDDITAWYLTKIESAISDHEITLSYFDDSGAKKVHKYVDSNGQTSAGGTAVNYNYSKGTRKVISEIESNVHKLVFNRFVRTDAKVPSDWPTNPNTSQEYGLSSIEVYQKSGQSEQLKLEYTFSYSYPGGRLFLDDIEKKGLNEKTMPFYSFDYNDPSELPDRLSLSTDHWGYFNDHSNSSLIPTLIYDENILLEEDGSLPSDLSTIRLFEGANRDVNPDVIRYGLLSKITTPTGGTEEFEYEANTYSKLFFQPDADLYDVVLDSSYSLNTVSGVDTFSFTTSPTSDAVIVDVYILHNVEGTKDFDGLFIERSSPFKQERVEIDTPDDDILQINETVIFDEGGTFDLELDYTAGNNDDDSIVVTLDVYRYSKVPLKYGPGARIKKITLNDGNSATPDKVKTFDFHYDSSGSTYSYGILFMEPEYREYQMGTSASLVSFFNGLSSNAFGGFGNAGKGMATYSKVISEEEGQGKTVSEFSTYSMALDLKLEENTNGWSYGTEYNNAIPTEHYLGKNTLTQQFDESGNKLVETESNFSNTEISRATPNAFFAVKLDYNQITPGNYNLQPFEIDASYLGIAFEETRVFEGGTTAVTSKTNYTYSNDENTLLYEKEAINSDGSKVTTKYRYAHQEYPAMEDSNMLSQVYSVLIEDANGDTLAKNWTTWSNSVTGNSNWNVEKQFQWEGSGTSDVTAPEDPTSEEVLISKINEYDAYGNPLETEDVEGTKTAYDWSEDGTSPIGVFQNADSDDVFAHSFAFDRFENWIFIDEDSDGDTDTTISNGKLKLTNYGSAENIELDRIYYEHESEITNSIVWEFDITIDDSDGSDLQINTGNASWNGGSTHCAVWSAIKNEEWRTHDGSGWVSIKTGLVVGKTYAFKIVMDPVSDEADYYVDGVRLKENISFRDASVSGIQKFAFGNYGYGTITTEWFIDNVRIYPEEAQAISQEVDPVFRTPLAVKDAAGSTNRFSFDEFGRMKESFNPNGERISRNVYFYSLDDHTSFDEDDPNRVEQITYNDPADTTDKTISVSYLDGLGRSIQSQTRAADSTAIVTGTLYDKHGRPHITSRPIELDVSSYTNGFVNNLWGTGFDGDPGEALSTGSEIYQYYDSGFSGTVDAQFAYTQTKFEDSPLSRQKGMGNAASALRLGQNDASMAYGLNSGSEDFVGFTDNELSKTISTDPNGNHTFSFTDGWGNTIASLVDMNGDSAKSSTDLVTTFQYDLRNQLTKVTDPRGLATDYTYNQRGQLVEKDMPDKDGSDEYRYDDRGNLRFTESAKHKNNGSQSTLYNAHLYSDQTLSIPGDGVLDFDISFSESSIDDEIDFDLEYEDGSDIFSYYFTAWETDASGVHPVGKGSYKLNQEPVYYQSQYGFLTEVIYKPFTFTYNNYDELNRITETGEYYGVTSFENMNPNNEVTGSKVAMQKYFYGESDAHADANNTKGRLAKTEYRDMHTYNRWGTTWYSYNSQGLVEWIIQDLPGSSMDEKKIEYRYDELGRITEMDYQAGASDEYYFRYSYDNLGRLAKTESKSSSGGSWVEHAEYTYLADGQLQEMNLGGNDQSVDYTYNSAGWLRFINDPDYFPESSSGFANDRFGMELRYYNNVGANADTLYNGNIAFIEWEQELAGTTVDEPEYQFNYDRANRLKSALYANASNNEDDNNGFDVSYTYDDNGNLKTIDRNDSAGVGDLFYALTHTSGTNKLSSAQVNGSGKSFEYDANGNMIENTINGLEGARYDARNLPYTLTIDGKTQYSTYDADGQRVMKSFDGTDTQYIRDAAGQTIAVYEDGSLVHINLLSGSDIIGTVDGSGNIEYFLKDHLGSVRTTVNSSGTAVSYQDFYPFGKIMPGRFSGSERYQFTGHERDSLSAQSSISYAGARLLGSDVPVWFSIDPMVDEYPGFSPYNYSLNNPINAIDPDGNAIYYVNGQEVYDDGEDNGIEIHTSQEIIDSYTDEDGNIDWLEVKNDPDSDFRKVDSKKFGAWQDEITAFLFNEGKFHRVSWNDRGTITGLVHYYDIRNESFVKYILAFFGGRQLAEIKDKGVLYKKKGDRTQFRSDINYSTVKKAIERMGGKTTQTPRGEVTTLKFGKKSISVRNFSNSGGSTLQINTGSSTIKIRINN